MDVLNALRCFVVAVDHGTLSGAAKVLRVSQPAVSQVLTGLEAHFGQKLLVRSRQGVRMTPAGELAYQYGQQTLDQLELLQNKIDALHDKVSGSMRVTTVQVLAQSLVGAALLKLQAQYPALKVDLIASDEVVDIEAQNIDFAIRLGSPGHGGGFARKIGEIESVLVAAPSYLAQAGYPKTAQDVAKLSYVQYRDESRIGNIVCTGPIGDVDIFVQPSFLAQNPNLIEHALNLGLGFTIAPRFFVENQLASGSLVEILPGLRPKPYPLYLVMLDEVRNSPRARVFQEAVVEEMGKAHGIHLSPELKLTSRRVA